MNSIGPGNYLTSSKLNIHINKNGKKITATEQHFKYLLRNNPYRWLKNYSLTERFFKHRRKRLKFLSYKN